MICGSYAVILQIEDTKESFLHLVPNGGEKVVTLDNVDEYVSATLDFILDHGIRKQMNAFRKGFNAVFPIERLGSFAPAEVSSLILKEFAALDFILKLDWAQKSLMKPCVFRSEQCFAVTNVPYSLVRTLFDTLSLS